MLPAVFESDPSLFEAPQTRRMPGQSMPVFPQTVRIEAEQGVSLSALNWVSKSEGSDAIDAQAPLVLLHGGGANAHWWDALAARWAINRPVLAFDFRGHGDSAYPEEHRVGAFGDDLEAVVDWLGREDIVFIGHSLGAAVALDHVSRFPNSRGLVLVDLARGTGTAPRRRARLALSFRRTYRSRQEAIDRFQFLPESSHATEALRVYVASHSVKEEADGRFGYKFDPAWFGLPSKPRPDLTKVAAKTLLVRGSESGLLSRESAQAFIDELPNGDWIEIADSGHHVLIDQPDALFEATEAFLATIG